MDLLERFPVDRIRDISYEAGRRILEISQNQEKWSVQYKVSRQQSNSGTPIPG